MTECTQTALQFPGFSRRKIDVSFNRGDITSNGGVQLLRLADERTGLIKAAARAIGDSRRTKSCTHALESLVRQRVYGISLGYEDLNDHEALRADLALQTALSRDESLASPSTLCRLENRANRNTAVALHKVLIDNFIASYKQAPRRLILDVDATDDRVHGGQEGRFFHGYYDHYCFLPLYVFCGDQLLVSYLRSSKIDGAKHSWAILALLIKRLRMENRIKEQQLGLFADRTSCHTWWANQFRLLLSSLAYTLLETLRRVALHGTALARAQCGTLRLKLLRIGAIVLRNTRRIRLLLSSAYPNRELFCLVAARLKPG